MVRERVRRIDDGRREPRRVLEGGLVCTGPGWEMRVIILSLYYREPRDLCRGRHRGAFISVWHLSGTRPGGGM